MRICFVGISGKPGIRKALSEETLSGKILSKVEAKLTLSLKKPVFFYDNLVRYAPLTDGKLRYPSLLEIKTEWRSFDRRVSKMKPDVVVLLGSIVTKSFYERREVSLLDFPTKNNSLVKWAGIDEKGRLILAVAHPSYVGVYARKRIGKYARLISQAINKNAS